MCTPVEFSCFPRLSRQALRPLDMQVVPGAHFPEKLRAHEMLGPCSIDPLLLPAEMGHLYVQQVISFRFYIEVQTKYTRTLFPPVSTPVLFTQLLLSNLCAFRMQETPQGRMLVSHTPVLLVIPPFLTSSAIKYLFLCRELPHRAAQLSSTALIVPCRD